MLSLERSALNFSRLDDGKVHKVNEFSDLICIKGRKLTYIQARSFTYRERASES
jgi:hypothetical protein